MTSDERERLAYISGDVTTAELLARVADLELERDTLADELEAANREIWELTNKGDS